MNFYYYNLIVNLLWWVMFCLAQKSWDNELLVGQGQSRYSIKELDHSDFHRISHLSNVTHLRTTVKSILKPRVVGTEGHNEVRDYIITALENLDWTILLDRFNDTVPIFGELQFENIIATLNPQAERYLVLSCHYDSKYMDDVEFVGAIDSAVPCAILINLATVLNEHLKYFRDTSLSLMLIFFDGEEAFKDWSINDSIYGSRHLAEKWQNENFLHRIDLLILLDLLGAPHPTFYSYFRNTQAWYIRLLNIEGRLSRAGLMERYHTNSMNSQQSERYFQPNALRSSFIEDDHTPFLQRNVPILHIIPIPFPNEWHTQYDNEAIIDYTTTENLARIIRLFTMEYLQGLIK